MPKNNAYGPRGTGTGGSETGRPKFMSVKELANQLRVAKNTAYKQVDQGLWGPVFKILTRQY